MTDTQVRVAFVCVQNAGRSQMSTVFAERERERRDLGDAVEILTGGTHPAEHVHDAVIEAMREEGFDLSGRTPRRISTDELESCDYVATIGRSTLDISGVGERILVLASGRWRTLTDRIPGGCVPSVPKLNSRPSRCPRNSIRLRNCFSE